MGDSMQTVSLANVQKMPLLGLGTYHLESAKEVRNALELGYRLLDTAHLYGNHRVIAEGIKGVARESLFLTTKLSLGQINREHVVTSIEKACELALKELNTSYIDLYLLHWPDRSLPMIEILKRMQGLIKEGKLRSIGVCNCTIHHLQDFIDAGIQVHVNQVEFHPYLYQKELWEFCKKQKIVLQSYRPLGKGKLVNEPIFEEIGKRHQKTPAQVILRWLIQKQIPTIPKASSEAHLKENLAIFDFVLTNAEMAQIDGLNKNIRYCKTEWSDFDY